MLVAGRPVELQRVTELTVRGADGQLGARLYVPREAGRGLLVFFHGGGWVVGDLETHDPLCRALAADAGIRVLAVDYRLAPEAPAPTSAEDAIAAFTWAVEHAEDLGVDPSLVAVGGDSAGGNLAAVVAQQTVRRNLPQPACRSSSTQALDLVGRRPSRDLFPEGFILTEDDIIWYRDHYTPDPTIRPNPLVSPLLAEDLTGLPPTYLTTAGFDPLRDEGNEYAQALEAAGNHLTHVPHPSLTHGYANLLNLPGATREAHTHLTNHLKSALHLVRRIHQHRHRLTNLQWSGGAGDRDRAVDVLPPGIGDVETGRIDGRQGQADCAALHVLVRDLLRRVGLTRRTGRQRRRTVTEIPGIADRRGFNRDGNPSKVMVVVDTLLSSV